MGLSLSTLLLNMKSEDVGQGPAHKMKSCPRSRFITEDSPASARDKCPVLTVEIHLQCSLVSWLAYLMDPDFLSSLPYIPQTFYVLVLISLFASLPYILLPSLLCKCGLFLSTSPPLFFFRNVNNFLPFHFPLLGQRPVSTVKICLYRPAGVNFLFFQHSILFAFLFLLHSLYNYPLSSFPMPSSVTFSSVFPSFLSFPYYGQSLISSLLSLHCQ
jgi:hypothetical protein